MAQRIPLDDCPFCGKKLEVDARGATQLAYHLEECPGKAEASQKLEDRARRARESHNSRIDRSLESLESPATDLETEKVVDRARRVESEIVSRLDQIERMR